MINFYEFICSDFNVNPSKSVQEIILEGTLYNAPRSLNLYINRKKEEKGEDRDQSEKANNSLNNDLEKEEEINLGYEDNPTQHNNGQNTTQQDCQLVVHKKNNSVSNEQSNISSSNIKNEIKPAKKPTTFLTKITKIDSNNNEAKPNYKPITITMKDFLANKQDPSYRMKLDLNNPNQVINAVEKEFKQVQIIPKTESFITQIGEFRDVKYGKKKRYEEQTLKNTNLNDSFKQNESKRKKKLLEYIMLQRSKNKYLLEAEKKKLQIGNELKLLEIDNNFKL